MPSRGLAAAGSFGLGLFMRFAHAGDIVGTGMRGPCWAHPAAPLGRRGRDSAIWAFAAGALIPLMAILNAGLARAAGGTIQATVLLFITGLIASLLLAAAAKAHFPAFLTLARIAPSQYAGGVIVGFYILSITFLAPRFGVVITEAVGSHILHQRRGSNGDQTSNKKPGYFFTQTGRVSPVAPRRCQGGAADGAGRTLRGVVV